MTHTTSVPTKRLECRACRSTFAIREMLTACSRCGGKLTVVLEGAGGPDGTRLDMWRYRAWLPFDDSRAPLSLGEGFSSLLELPELSDVLGGARLFLKMDAWKNPTGTFKDREASLIISRCQDLGLDNLVFYSTSNTGRAYTHYAAAAGLTTYCFIPGQCHYKQTASIRKGPQNFLIEVADDYPRIAPYAKAFAAANGFHLVAPLHERTEAYTTVAFEQAEQLPGCEYFAQTIASGMGAIGFLRGHEHLVGLGLSTPARTPRILCVQSSETNAMARAYTAGKREMTAADLPATFPPDLFEPTLNSTNPLNNYADLRDCLDASAGRITDVEPGFVREEGAAFAAALSACGVTARFDLERSLLIGWAGLVRLAHEGQFQRGDRIVLLATGRGDAPVETLLQPDLLIRPAVDDPHDLLRRLGAAAQRSVASPGGKQAW